MVTQKTKNNIKKFNAAREVLIKCGFREKQTMGDALSHAMGEPSSYRYTLKGVHINEWLQAGLEGMLARLLSRYGYAWSWHFHRSLGQLETIAIIDHPGDKF